MADRAGSRQHRTIHQAQVDLEAVRHSVKIRSKHRPVRASASSRAAQAHADAIGAGKASVSPFPKRVIHRQG